MSTQCPTSKFLALQRGATVVITDSGGIQEEITHLGVPYPTLRSNTERPVTVTMGTNTLAGQDCQKLSSEPVKIYDGKGKAALFLPCGTGTRESALPTLC